jgi:hypothetical protein
VIHIPKAGIRIDGVSVDPCVVVADAPKESAHSLEVQIAADIVLHELQECHVGVSRETLVSFLSSDARTRDARHSYLTIARHVISPLPQHKSVLGLFRRASVGHKVTPIWAWTHTLRVELTGEMITFFGLATKL